MLQLNVQHRYWGSERWCILRVYYDCPLFQIYINYFELTKQVLPIFICVFTTPRNTPAVTSQNLETPTKMKQPLNPAISFYFSPIFHKYSIRSAKYPRNTREKDNHIKLAILLYISQFFRDNPSDPRNIHETPAKFT